MGALNTAGKVAFLPEDSPFLEYTDIRMNTHHGRWQREGPSPLNPAAPTGKEKGDLKLEKG